MEKIKVGIIGLGGMAKGSHIPSLQRLPDAEIVSVCDRNEPAAKELGEKMGVNSYGDMDEMLKFEKLDAAYILTPAMLHHDMVINAMEKGLHVFCEKPPALSMKDMTAMCETANQKNRLLLFGFNRRYSPFYSTLKKLSENARINSFIIQKVKPPMSWTENQDRLSGKLILENGIHFIDLARWICGEITDITFKSAKTMDLTSSDNQLSALISHESGAETMLCLSYTSGLNTESTALHADGTSCFSKFDSDGKVIRIFRNGENSEFLPPEDNLLSFGFFQETETFISCIREGRKLPFRPEEFIGTMRWILECSGTNA